MKIRTITTGVPLAGNPASGLAALARAAEFNRVAGKVFGDRGFEVQTTRLAAPPWSAWLAGLPAAALLDRVRAAEAVAEEHGISFLNAGPAESEAHIGLVPDLLAATTRVSVSATIADPETGIRRPAISSTARAMRAISETTPSGYGNFRFCASACCPPGIPFFPAGFHDGGPASFSIGLEAGDLCCRAFAEASDLADAELRLRDLMTRACRDVQGLAELVSAGESVPFAGIDTSLAPSLEPQGSLALAFEHLGLGRFGGHATLAVAAMVTRVLKSLPVRSCGYRGLMLPVCEDVGLAARAGEQAFSLTSLLCYSSVCGTGLDTVPVPGDTPVERIEALLLDVAALAVALKKPLSARLLLAPGLAPGDMARFGSPYLVDCPIMPIV
jgi:uncharacterized protein (UPF0210 family)